MRKTFVMTLICMTLILVFSVGCSGESTIAKYRDNLDDYNKSSDIIVTNMKLISEKNSEMQGFLDTDDMASYGSSIKLIGDLLDQTISEAEKLKTAGAAIDEQNNAAVSYAEPKFDPVTLLGTALVTAGVIGFCKVCKTLQQKASQQWKDASDTFADVGDDKATVEDYKEKKDLLIETHQEFGNELGSRIMTANIPGNPTTTAGVILKEIISNTAQEGSKVIFATKGCAVDAESSDCKVGAVTSDQDGKVPVFPEKSDISITKDGMARVVVEDVEVPSGSTEEIVRAEIPIEEATPEIVTQNDDGTYDPAEVEEPAGNITILCYTFTDGVGHYACLKYNGSESELQNGNYDNATMQCLNADYKQYQMYSDSDESCRAQCTTSAIEAYGDCVCDTP